MAWSASGLYYPTFVDMFDATHLIIDLLATTHKWALYNNSITPSFQTDATYTSTNEVSGTGYTAGGQALSVPSTRNPTVAWSSDHGGDLKYTHDPVTWQTASVTAYGAILYADAATATPDALIVGVNFAGVYTATSGNFVLTPAADGVFYLDLTP